MNMPFTFMASRGSGDEIYLEVASGVTLFMLAGRFFEARAKRRSGAALRALLDLGAKDVVVLRNNREIRIALEALDVGDEFVVRPGEKIATDGMLLTGDNQLVARSVAREVGIAESDVIADVLPADKVEVVQRLQDEGKVVAMVGDGVNDAAALAQADLGLAMGTGTDVAIEASDLTLVRGDLRAAVDAIRLARRTLSTIRANLFWASCVQRRSVAAGRSGPAQPHAGRRGNGSQLHLRRVQQPAPPRVQVSHRPGPLVRLRAADATTPRATSRFRCGRRTDREHRPSR
jgi:cation transport ATPase